MYQALYGNAVAEKVLLYIANYGEGHITKIARTYEISATQVRKQLIRLEAGGVLISRNNGTSRTSVRTFSLNPRLAIRKELLALLERQLELLPKDQIQKYYRERTRPRRTGKDL